MDKKSVDVLHCLTWDASPLSHLEQVEQLCRGGARWIQLRSKNSNPADLLQLCYQSLEICREFGVTLVLNDFPQLALQAGLHGVHVGLSDMPIAQARALLGESALIGGTANTAEQVLKHIAEGADYVGIGPFRATSTKENLKPILGINGVALVVRKVHDKYPGFPLIVVGGITPQDVTALQASGVHGFAVCSALVGKKAIAESLLPFLKITANKKIQEKL